LVGVRHNGIEPKRNLGGIVDTVLVRSLLVPAMSYDIGRKIWWPSKLAKGKL
jgi:RND superfamily putative drug exporter